jgi:hypothetical protein
MCDNPTHRHQAIAGTAKPWFRSVFSDDYRSRPKDNGWCPTCGGLWYSFHFQLLKIQSMRKRGKVKPGQTAFVRWGFHVGDLITAAAMSCQFCCFFAIRFFLHARSEHNLALNTAAACDSWIGCCTQRAFNPKPEDIVRKLAEVARPFIKDSEGDWFVMHVIPAHSKGKPLPDFDQLRFDLHETDVLPDMLQKILGCRRSLTVEVFASEGKNIS